MAMQETNARQEARAAKDVLVQKKPYEKPQIIYRAPLEAMAGFCNPAGGGKGSPFTCTIVSS